MSQAARSHRSAAQGASRSPYRAPSVSASGATPRCAPMASADRQMTDDATLAPSGHGSPPSPPRASAAGRLPDDATLARPGPGSTAAPMLSSTAAPHPGRRAHPAAWYATTFEAFHETDSVGSPPSRKGHARG